MHSTLYTLHDTYITLNTTDSTRQYLHYTQLTKYCQQFVTKINTKKALYYTHSRNHAQEMLIKTEFLYQPLANTRLPLLILRMFPLTTPSGFKIGLDWGLLSIKNISLNTESKMYRIFYPVF